MVRAEEDADGDGRVDVWSTYVNGILTATDADGDGRPDGDGRSAGDGRSDGRGRP